MKKLCWLLILVLLLSCFAGCQATPAASRPIENEDGTLADWMKEEIANAYQIEPRNLHWWDPQNPGKVYNIRYLGSYDGYVMFHKDAPYDAVWEGTIAGYDFAFPTKAGITVYKDGEFYQLDKMFEQGLIDKEAVRIAYECDAEFVRILVEYRKQQQEK